MKRYLAIFILFALVLMARADQLKLLYPVANVSPTQTIALVPATKATVPEPVITLTPATNATVSSSGSMPLADVPKYAIVTTNVAMTSDDIEFENIQKRIYGVESRFGTNLRHTDGSSIGPFGLTFRAMRELKRLKLITRMPTVKEMMDYASAKRLCGLYLQLQKKRFHCKTWRGAAGFYHNQTSEAERNDYRNLLDNII